tara:strand:- start:194 stop:697 length:504 start_codon:yes stop_codon:yes gene_type:complete
MGATEFAIDNFGKTVGDAYNKQVDSDHYEHGHSGYTGTLAEKDGFVLIDRPTRITAGRLMDTIIDAEQWMFWLYTDEKCRYAYIKPKAKCKKAWARLNEWFPSNPRTGKFFVEDHAYGVGASDICRLYGEKWGPALAVEQSPAEKKARWNDLPRGSKTFLFFGMASC